MSSPTTDTSTAAAQKIAMIPQPHGGALKAGGTPGNRGGKGVPSEFRTIMRGDAMAAREELIQRLSSREPCGECGRKMSDADVMRWFDLAAKYGQGPPKGALDASIVQELARAVRQHTTASDVELTAIYEAWAVALGRMASGE